MRGLATPDGTARYAARHAAGEGHWRRALGLTLSSIGFGSYLGPMTDAKDAAYADAFATGLRGGVNVLDTASIYRGGRSERAVGRGIRDAGVARDGFLVATKGGFTREGDHRIDAAFLRGELDASLDRLGLDAVDVYFVHNPEAQLQQGAGRDALDATLRETFAMLEERRKEGRIAAYGLATWHALRVPPEHALHVPLERALDLARHAGGAAHGLRAVELPFNLAMPEAATAPTQPWRGARVPALHAAREAGLLVLGSASLLQTRLLGHVPLEEALDFARAAPGMTTALVGTGDPAHARQNLAVAARALAT